MAALEALKCLDVKKTVGHISTIAATYIPEDQELLNNFDPQAIEYCLGRRRVDLLLNNCGIPTTILRPGFVFNDLLANGVVDSGHDYSP